MFAGANPGPTGVYAGRYNSLVAGKIQWDASPEFTPNGFQRIMGFSICNDTLYMATQREVYKRVDGINPVQRWVQVLNIATPANIAAYGANLDPYWLNDDDIRGLRTISNPIGNGEVLFFGCLNHMFRLHPQTNYQLIAEKDIENLIDSITGHNFHYLQTQQTTDFINPITNELSQLIGFEGFYDTTYLAANPQPNVGGFNKQGYYFERKQIGASITYHLREIIDPSITNQPDALARVRTIQISPFAEDSSKVIYAGGFAPWFLENSGGVTKTAWIYRGTLNQQTTGLFDNNIEVENFIIYPNPGTAEINIVLPNTNNFTTEIINTFGEIVLHSQNQNKIDVSQLTHGIYFLKVSNRKTIYTKKIIINK